MLKRADYPSFTKAMKPLHVGPLLIWNVEFDVDSSNALGAPVTECATIRPKGDHSLQEVIASMKKLQAMGPRYKSMHGVSIGKINEVNGKIFVVIGWDSIKVRHIRTSIYPTVNGLTEPYIYLF
jgi:hypothetical protein